MVDNSKSFISTKGIGLGLCISSQLVKKFNGIIDFTSKIGVGSNFFFTFEVDEIIEEYNPFALESGFDFEYNE